MKKILNALIIVVMIVVGFTFTFGVNAASSDVYNVVTCPSEDMATSMRVNWQSDTDFTDLKVEYTVATDTEYKNSITVNGVYRSFSRQNGDPKNAVYNGFSTPRHIWNAELTGLSPKTKYIYRITDGSKNYTDNYSFETGALNEEEFSFLFMTDPQYYEKIGASKFNFMTETHLQNDDIKFTFITGDISDKGGDSSYWEMFYDKSSLKKTVFATTVGNHEYYDKGTVTTDNLIYNQFFNNPQNGPEHVKGSSYWFVYNKALFIMLDSEDKNNLVEQQQWFRNVCNNIECSYIIVGTHKSSFAGAEYAEDGKYFYQKWGHIFDECQVDLVLSGHDHMYARTKPIINGEVVDEDYKGTTYILGGSAGIKYYSKKDDTNLDKWDCYFDQRTVCSVITLGENLKVKTYEIGSVDGTKYTRGELKDSCVLQRKRFGTVDTTFTKEEFEKSFTVKNNMPDLTSGSVSWSEKGYGYVKNVTVTNLNSKERLGSVSFINNQATKLDVNGKFWIGEINKIQVDIAYKDGTSAQLLLELNNDIDWGTINSASATNITSSTFTLVINAKFNKDVEYIDRIRLIEGDSVRKNYFLKAEDLEKEILEIELSKNLMEPLTTKTYKVQAMNVNGTIIWEQELTVTSLKELSEEALYQYEMANIAFKAMIDNLLKALLEE